MLPSEDQRGGSIPDMGADGRRYQGEIIEWSDEKQSGFVRPRGSGAHDPVVYLARSALLSGDRGPRVGDAVIFEIEHAASTGSRKRLRTTLRARRVVFVGDDQPLRTPSKGERPVCCLAIVYVAAVGVAMAMTQTQPWPLLWTVALSGLAFIATCWDKLMALRKTFRVSEKTLLTLALLGGWPGSALAQAAIRHKTTKEPFRTVFRWMIAVNVVASFIAFGILVATKPPVSQ